MILLIDSYDSFVHTLARYLQELGCETLVVRNDAMPVDDVARLAPQAIVLSPGPGTPTEAGITVDVVRRYGAQIPMLGVCLGHQAIAAALGAEVVRAAEPMHGMTSLIYHDETGLFSGIPSPFSAARYHSLIVEERSLPKELLVTARTAEGTIMALRHRQWATFGVQFHPESVLTEHGHQLLANFLMLAKVTVPDRLPQPDRPADAPTNLDFYRRPLDPAALRPL